MDIDMYKGAEIVEDLGDKVRIKPKRGSSKIVYKSLLHQFAQICNKDGLTLKGMSPYMQHLTIWERTTMDYLQRDGYYIMLNGNDYSLMDDSDVEVHKIAKRIVHKLYNQNYLRKQDAMYVINPHKFK